MSPLAPRVTAARTALLVPDWLNRPIDRDISKLVLNDTKVSVDIATAVTGGEIIETMEGAGSLSIDIHDPKGTLKKTVLKDWIKINPSLYPLVNGKRKLTLTNGSWKDVYAKLDGRDYALAGVNKQSMDYTLTFQNRGVSELQRYRKHRMWYRDAFTRAQVIADTLREIRGYHIPFYSPEIHKIQSIATSVNTPSSAQNAALLQPGIASSGKTAFASNARIMVKGQVADPQKISYISRVLATGKSMNAPYPVEVSAIMCITQESDVTILRDPATGIGLFSQLRNGAWPATGDNIEADASAYFKQAIRSYAQNPTQSLADLVQSVQHSGAGPTYYAQWEAESKATVGAWLGSPSASQASSGYSYQITEYQRFAFERGQNGTPENSWEFDRRLAEEVAWRLFFIDNTLYYVEDNQLIRQRPLATLSESDDGIDTIDYDIDDSKSVATCTITAHADRWQVPPGAVVLIDGEGPPDGRWLIHQTRWPLYGKKIEVTCQVATPPKPEPSPQTKSSSINVPGTGPAGGGGKGSLANKTFNDLNAAGIVTWAGHGWYSQQPVEMCAWIANELNWGIDNGWRPQYAVTSGYRPGFDSHTSSGKSEHQGTSFNSGQRPSGAIDFGSYVSPAGKASKLALIDLASKLGYPGPRLVAPIGFDDDGHCSGNGH